MRTRPLRDVSDSDTEGEKYSRQLQDLNETWSEMVD